MRKKFKKRLLGIILTILMVVSVIPVQQAQPVKAAAGDTIQAGTTIYLRPNAATTWIKDNAVMAFKTSADNKQSEIVVMTKMDDGLTWSGETTAEATNIDFLRLDPNDKHVWNEAGTWPGLERGKNLYTFALHTGVTPTGMWTTYSSTGSETTSYFNVNATLVDYFNDNRVDMAQSEDKRHNNQGNEIGPDKAPYSKLNQWLSGLKGYALDVSSDPKDPNAPVPLYFGDLLHKSQAGGNGTLTWYWQGANVAFGSGDSYYTKDVAQGIVGKNLDDDGNLITSYKYNDNSVKVPFFNEDEDAYPNQSKYMQFYNNLQFPFTKTTNDKGVSTYSFNSENNNVYYDYASKKIVRKDDLVINNAKGDNRGYFPFNSSNPSNKNELNYGFGTQFTIPFTVTENGQNVDDTPMTFKFTGDDDVWVYIDGALVLDMGGAHCKAEGEINFATQMATITTGTSDAKLGNQPTAGGRVAAKDNGNRTVDFKNITVKKSDGKTISLADYMKESGKVHELKMYYMERGMWDSNMSISYSFVPLPSGLTLSKTLDTTDVNAGLKNAVQGLDNFDFKIQKKNLKTDEANYSDVENLGYTLYDYDDRTFPGQEAKDSTATFSSSYFASDFINTKDKNNSSAFYAGTGFQITESIPQGTKLQYDTSKTRWGVYDSITSRAAIEGGKGAVATFNMGDDTSSEMDVVNRYVNFVNTPKVGSLSVAKKYEGYAPENETFGFTVLVDLTGHDYYDSYKLEYTGTQNGTTDENGHFTLKVGDTVTFAGIPAGATYKVVEDAPGADDTWVQDTSKCTGLTGKIVAEVPSAAVVTNKTKTTEENHVIYAEAGKPVTYAPKGVTITKLTKPTTGDQDIDTAVNTADGKGVFTPESANKKYDVNYEGTTDKGNFTGKITVLTYKATDKVYVFDYGLESNIAEKNANGDGLFQGGTFYNKEATGDMATTAKLGKITAAEGNTQTTISGSDIVINKDESAKSAVTFKPVAFMDKVENYTYTANITKNGKTLDPKGPETGTTVNGTIKTMPANVVYYEDNFNANSTTTDGTTKIVYTEGTNEVGTPPDVKLTQSNGQTEQYGHDDAYTTGTGDSNGTSKEMTEGAKATFTFTGTGFDVIARTTSNTAGITYIVSKKVGESWTAVSVGAVDTYYANGELYQIPVIHKDLGEKNTYKVTLRATESTKANVIYLDGIRIYNPLGTEDNEKYIDNEKGATFVKVSDLVLGNGKVTETGIDGAITNQVIDGSKAAILGYAEGEGKALSALGYTIVEDNTNGSAGSTTSDSILQYLQAGPNNEVYLDETAAVAFVATADSAVTNKTIQVEAKLADLGQFEGNKPEPSKGMELRVIGADGTANVVANVTSSTAMYYSIDLTKCIDLGDNKYLVVIVGNSDYEPDEDYESGGTHCISFTNIKYKGYEFSSPYENDAAKKYIDMTVFDADRTKFASIDFPSVHKNVWSNYKCSVTLNENVFGDAAPKFKLYYKNINGKLEPISVTAKRTKEDSNKYELRFRAPNAIGNFAVELHYVVNGKESDDYIATTMTVKR
jgi:cell surface protein